MIITRYALLGALAFAMPAQAAFRPAPNTSHTVDLDTAAGAFSVWDAKDLTGINAAHIHFRVNQVRSDKKWAPSFNFVLKRGNESVGIGLIGFAGKKPLLIALKRSGAEDEAFLLPTEVGEENDLEITWTPAGDASFTLKNAKTQGVTKTGEHHTGKLSGAPEMLHIMSSTGELEVMSIVLGSDDGR